MEIIIRAYSNDDLDDLEKIRNDVDLQYSLLVNPKPNTRQRVLEWIEKKTSDSDSVFFVISNEKNDTIGYVQAVSINTLNKNCYVGMVLGKEWRGKGIFKPAISLVEKYLLNTYNLKKFIAEILESNSDSINAFRNNGYNLSGTMKEHFYYKSKFHNVCIYEKLL
jgi:diamine N-acetyltransferase